MLKYFHIVILALIPALWCAPYQTDEELNSLCDCVVDISTIKAFLEQQKSMQQKLDNLMERQNNHTRVIEPKKLPATCVEAMTKTNTAGVYSIQIDTYKEGPFLVECVDQLVGSHWLVIQRRIDADTDFHRNWTDYKIGFGDIERSFWIGLDKIHAMTTRCVHELLIVMQDYNGTKYFARYDKFAIGNESQDYELVLLGDYSGTAGNALTQHRGRKFTTLDRDNDRSSKANCAQLYTGGWWYDDCYYSHLNGNYTERNSGKGVTWNGIVQNQSLKLSEMLIRPKGNC